MMYLETNYRSLIVNSIVKESTVGIKSIKKKSRYLLEKNKFKKNVLVLTKIKIICIFTIIQLLNILLKLSTNYYVLCVL